MAGAGAGLEQGPGDPEAPGVAPEDLRDWAGLPEHLLMKVAGTLVAQTEAGEAARLKEVNPTVWTAERLQVKMAKRKVDGNCLFVFARVCKGWRKAQLKVGGPLRTRVESDVILPGSVALAKWALAEGCPRKLQAHPSKGELGYRMAEAAARYGHLELVKWLCREFPDGGGFLMDLRVMASAVRRGNLELVRWLRGEGCDWSFTCERLLLRPGSWRSCSGCGARAARGTPRRATMQSTMVTWRRCAGPARTAARGPPTLGTGRPRSLATPTTSATSSTISRWRATPSTRPQRVFHLPSINQWIQSSFTATQ